MAEEKACAFKKTKIGGQALIEGVMMKGAYKGAMACRLPDGSMDVEIWDERNGKNAQWYKKVPFIRGISSFIISLVDGYKYMMKSAEKQMVDEEEDNNKKDIPSNFQQSVENDVEIKKSTKKIENNDEKKSALNSALMVVSVILGLVIAIALFAVLPKILVGAVKPVYNMKILRSLFEGIIKVAIFILYMWLTGKMKDTHRTYMYHGAEHKTIWCYEKRLPLTIENVKKQTRLHPRCGTSFIFIVLIISILLMCFIPFTVTWQRILCGICLLPFVVSISYEFIRFAGKSESFLAKILSWPGLQIQRITTQEPDASMIECAIAALKPCIPENEEDDIWG